MKKEIVTRAFSVLDNIYERCIRYFAIFAGILILFVMLSVFFDVTLRYFFNRPVVWVLEMSEYAMVYVTFLGAAWVLKNDDHIKVDILLAMLRPKHAEILNFAISIVLVIVCLILFYLSAKTTWSHYTRHILSMKYFVIPIYTLMFVIPFGSFLLIIQSLKRMNFHFRLIKNDRERKN